MLGDVTSRWIKMEYAWRDGVGASGDRAGRWGGDWKA